MKNVKITCSNCVSRILFFLLFTFSFSLFTFSQQPLTHSKKAERFYFDARDFYQVKDYKMAITAIDKAISEDSLFAEAYLIKGKILEDLRRNNEAIAAYHTGLLIKPDMHPGTYAIVATMEQKLGLYRPAREDFLKYLSFEALSEVQKNKAAGGLKACEFAIHQIDNPVPFAPVNLGDSINTSVNEYINAITSDNQRLYFTRALRSDSMTIVKTNEFEEDFFISVRKDSLWKRAHNLGPPINTHGNEGAICISPDGQYLFFAACDRPDTYGSCDIYWSKKLGNTWSEPANLGPVVNSENWDSQPSFSSDGKTLFFASKRPGGKGSSDIWKAELTAQGEWSSPVNLGDSINTPEVEMAPFIHPDDLTLYFSSKGHQGMGGLDLFYARKDIDGKWKKPINLGYPINTNADEITLVVNASGNLAYISTDKLGGKGGQDIYAFPLYEKARPVKVNYFKGIVFDKESKKRLLARFELIDLESGKTMMDAHSDPLNGEFLVLLPTDKNYALNVSKQGYLFYSEHFELKGDNSKSTPFIKNIPLQMIKVGETVVLKNIFFDTDKFELKPESQSELNRLIALLHSNPTLKIEISGHTDNSGGIEHNLTLSKNRAKSVYDFLVSKGILTTRLTHNGYGASKPIDSNETEQGKANNRRTEFKVIGQ
ncbi:MAG: OmpA family protein [Bacteroidota bacterium]